MDNRDIILNQDKTLKSQGENDLQEAELFHGDERLQNYDSFQQGSQSPHQFFEPHDNQGYHDNENNGAQQNDHQDKKQNENRNLSQPRREEELSSSIDSQKLLTSNISTYLYIPYPILITYPYNPLHKTFISVFSHYEIREGSVAKSIIQPTLITLAPPHLIIHTTDSPKPSRHRFDYILNRKNEEPRKIALSLNGLFIAFLQKRDLIIWNLNEKETWGTHHWSRSKMEISSDQDTKSHSSLSLGQRVMKRMSVRGLMSGYFDDDGESSQSSKLLDCYWLLNEHLIVVSTYAVELYKLDYSERLLVKLKTLLTTSKTIIYSKFSNNILLVYVGKRNASVIQLVYNNHPSVLSYTSTKPTRVQFEVHSRDEFVYPEELSIHQIYNKPCILYICTKKQELSVYRNDILKSGFSRKLTYSLFGLPGRYLVSVIDSLIFVHNVKEKLTVCYDIRWRERKHCAIPMSMDAYSTNLSDFRDSILRSTQRASSLSSEEELVHSKQGSSIPDSPHPESIMSDRETICVDEILPISEISNSSIDTDFSSAKDSKEYTSENCIRKKSMTLTDIDSHFSESEISDCSQVRLYSRHWKVIEPNFIFDVTTGCLFQLQFSLKDLQSSIRPTHEYLKFILRRADGKQIFLDSFREFIEKGGSIREIKTIFHDTNRRLKAFLKFKQEFGANNSNVSFPFPVINQTDIYSSILHPLEVVQADSPARAINITIEYIHSLAELSIPIEPFLQKILILQLIEHNDFGLLHEFVQYKVISDSIETATMVYRLSKQYPPAFQIAMDMLSRLREYETMCEFLLDCGKVVHAIKMIHDHRISISYQVVFDAVLKKNDTMLFYNAYEILRVLNKRTRGDAKFLPSDNVADIEARFAELFLKHDQN